MCGIVLVIIFSDSIIDEHYDDIIFICLPSVYIILYMCIMFVLIMFPVHFYRNSDVMLNKLSKYMCNIHNYINKITFKLLKCFDSQEHDMTWHGMALQCRCNVLVQVHVALCKC